MTHLKNGVCYIHVWQKLGFFFLLCLLVIDSKILLELLG